MAPSTENNTLKTTSCLPTSGSLKASSEGERFNPQHRERQDQEHDEHRASNDRCRWVAASQHHGRRQCGRDDPTKVEHPGRVSALGSRRLGAVPPLWLRRGW